LLTVSFLEREMRDRCALGKSELIWRGGDPIPSSRIVAEERPVALTYNGSTYAVMMASPADLVDFGIGFSLTEGIVEHSTDILSIEVIDLELGCEIRMWLDSARGDRLAKQRRAMVGATGCGLCGVESLEQACRALPGVVSEGEFSSSQLLKAVQALRPLQHHNAITRAMHAAAFWDGDSVKLVREDVGRHNAMDKLAGAMAGCGLPAERGAVLLTSRVSVELVQKAAMIGVPLLVAISAPTSLAIETADRAGITLVAVARDDGYEIFTHPSRLNFGEIPASTPTCRLVPVV
jgi:FdhD protein